MRVCAPRSMIVPMKQQVISPMNFESGLPTLAARSGELAVRAPEHQALALVQDTAGFVNRGLVVLWREMVGHELLAEADQASYFAQARALILRDDAAGLGRLLHAHPFLLEMRAADEAACQLLHCAALAGACLCAGLLLEHGAPVDAPGAGATPLLLAAEAGHEKLARQLVAAGADVNVASPGRRETALHLAAAQGQLDLAEALIQAGADLEAQASWHSCDEQLGAFNGNGALHAAALHDKPGLIRLLLKAGAERDTCASDLRTPLHYAAARGHVASLEVLLAAGADPDALDCYESDGVSTQRSALQYAVLNRHVAASAMLLCYGARPELPEPLSAESAVQMAQRLGHAVLLRLLTQAARGEAGEGLFSYLDAQVIRYEPSAYAELRAFLLNLLAEFPMGHKSLLVLSDWLAEMLGAENRPHLIRAYRELQAGGAP